MTCGRELRRARRSESTLFLSSRRRRTRYWRDWSSDVCSSDLLFAVWRHVPKVVARSGGSYSHGVAGHEVPAREPLDQFPGLVGVLALGRGRPHPAGGPPDERMVPRLGGELPGIDLLEEVVDRGRALRAPVEDPAPRTAGGGYQLALRECFVFGGNPRLGIEQRVYGHDPRVGHILVIT